MDDMYDPNYRFDASNQIHETAIIHYNVTMGKGNKIGAYTVIGSDGEIRGIKEFKGKVVIGDNNIISELVTIQRPANEASTIIGDDNLIMAHSHIGHDAKIGSNCEISTGSIIGGYATVRDGAKIKLGVTVRNRKVVGKNAIAGMGSVVVKDVDEGSIVVGNPAKVLKR
jgi:UDP-N-acetylglucosamine acyltransferase